MNDIKICGELDFHTFEGAVAYLKGMLTDAHDADKIYVTFNDIGKLGDKWAKANQKNSQGRKRLTFWTSAMMTKALITAGFVRIMPTDKHVGGPHAAGVSTLVAMKPPKQVEKKPLTSDEKPAISKPKPAKKRKATAKK